MGRGGSNYLVGMLPPKEWDSGDVQRWYKESFPQWAMNEPKLAEELAEFSGVDLLDPELREDLLSTIRKKLRRRQFERKLIELRDGSIVDAVKVVPLQTKPWRPGEKGRIAIAIFNPEFEEECRRALHGLHYCCGPTRLCIERWKPLQVHVQFQDLEVYGTKVASLVWDGKFNANFSIAAKTNEQLRDATQVVRIGEVELRFTVELAPHTTDTSTPVSPIQKYEIFWYICRQRNDIIEPMEEYKRVFCGEATKTNYCCMLTPQASRQEFYDSSTGAWKPGPGRRGAQVVHLAGHATSRDGLLWVLGKTEATERCLPEDLAAVFCQARKNGAPIDLIFLNACDSVHTVKAVLDQEQQAGCTQPISFVFWATQASDDACKTAAKEFYKALDEQPNEYKRAFDHAVSKIKFDHPNGFNCPLHYPGSAGKFCFVQRSSDGVIEVWVGSEQVVFATDRPVDACAVSQISGCTSKLQRLPEFKLAVYGGGRVGKTSFVSQLAGGAFNAHEPSTQVGAHVIIQAKHPWQVLRIDELVGQINFPSCKQLATDSSDVTTRMFVYDSAGQQRFSDLHHKLLATAARTLPVVVFDLRQPLDSKVIGIANDCEHRLLQSVWAEAVKCGDVNLSVVSRAMANDMRKFSIPVGQKRKVDPTAADFLELATKFDATEATAADQVLCWLRSIHIQDPGARILLVGTNRMSVSPHIEQTQLEKMRRLVASVSGLKAEIMAVENNPDSLQPNETRHLGIKEVQDKILEIGQDLPGMEKEYPTIWLHILQEMVTTGHLKSIPQILNVDTISNCFEKIGFGSGDLHQTIQGMLAIFHNTGRLLYFGDGSVDEHQLPHILAEWVIVDPSMLLDVIASITSCVKIRGCMDEIHRTEGASQQYKAWATLLKSGQLQHGLLASDSLLWQKYTNQLTKHEWLQALSELDVCTLTLQFLDETKVKQAQMTESRAAEELDGLRTALASAIGGKAERLQASCVPRAEDKHARATQAVRQAQMSCDGKPLPKDGAAAWVFACLAPAKQRLYCQVSHQWAYRCHRLEIDPSDLENTHYATLGLSNMKASKTDVERICRRKSRQSHPDRIENDIKRRQKQMTDILKGKLGAHAETERKKLEEGVAELQQRAGQGQFEAVQTAKEDLTDGTKREAYDIGIWKKASVKERAQTEDHLPGSLFNNLVMLLCAAITTKDQSTICMERGHFQAKLPYLGHEFALDFKPQQHMVAISLFLSPDCSDEDCRHARAELADLFGDVWPSAFKRFGVHCSFHIPYSDSNVLVQIDWSDTTKTLELPSGWENQTSNSKMTPRIRKVWGQYCDYQIGKAGVCTQTRDGMSKLWLPESVAVDVGVCRVDTAPLHMMKTAQRRRDALQGRQHLETIADANEKAEHLQLLVRENRTEAAESASKREGHMQEERAAAREIAVWEAEKPNPEETNSQIMTQIESVGYEPLDSEACEVPLYEFQQNQDRINLLQAKINEKGKRTDERERQAREQLERNQQKGQLAEHIPQHAAKDSYEVNQASQGNKQAIAAERNALQNVQEAYKATFDGNFPSAAVQHAQEAAKQLFKEVVDNMTNFWSCELPRYDSTTNKIPVGDEPVQDISSITSTLGSDTLELERFRSRVDPGSTSNDRHKFSPITGLLPHRTKLDTAAKLELRHSCATTAGLRVYRQEDSSSKWHAMSPESCLFASDSVALDVVTFSNYLVGMETPEHWTQKDVQRWLSETDTFEDWEEDEPDVLKCLKKFKGKTLLACINGTGLARLDNKWKDKELNREDSIDEVKSLANGSVEDRVFARPLQQDPWRPGETGQIALALYTEGNEEICCKQFEAHQKPLRACSTALPIKLIRWRPVTLQGKFEAFSIGEHSVVIEEWCGGFDQSFFVTATPLLDKINTTQTVDLSQEKDNCKQVQFSVNIDTTAHTPHRADTSRPSSSSLAAAEDIRSSIAAPESYETVQSPVSPIQKYEIFWYICRQRNDIIEPMEEYKRVFCGEATKTNYCCTPTPQASRQEFYDSSTGAWKPGPGRRGAQVVHLAGHATSRDGLLWVLGKTEATERCLPEDLAAVFCQARKNGAPIDLISLNACGSVHTVKAVLDQEQQAGCTQPISFVCWATQASDDACKTAAKEFYKALDEQPNEYKRAFDHAVSKIKFDHPSGGLKCPVHCHGAAGEFCFVQKTADSQVKVWVGNGEIPDLLQHIGCIKCNTPQRYNQQRCD